MVSQLRLAGIHGLDRGVAACLWCCVLCVRGPFAPPNNCYCAPSVSFPVPQMAMTTGLLETMRALPSTGYYYGSITIEQAESILANEPNHSFIVRDSTEEESRSHDTYCITFKSENRYGSIRVDCAKGYFCLALQDPEMPIYQTLTSLVEDAVRMSRQGDAVCILSGHVEGREVDLFLRNPVSHLKKVSCLQHLCRSTVHKSLRRDQFERLDLPSHMQAYLQSSPHFDASLYPAATCQDGLLERELERRSPGKTETPTQ